MKDEIKEILEFLQPIENRHCATLGNTKCKLLLDYITNLEDTLIDKQECIDAYNEIINNRDKEITNLQQENERLKKALNCKEYFSSTMPEDTEFVILTKNNYDRQQKDIELELIDYKSRCEKAVELINLKIIRLYHELDYNLGIEDLKDIENILQNGSDSQ